MQGLQVRTLALRAGLAASAAGALAAAAGGTLWWQLFRRPLPRTEGRLEVPGLAGGVTIRRDRWGVPHISAGDRHDLWFGEGFCHGQDRLWQLEIYRRAARGRVAEMAGSEALSADRLMRTLGFGRVAEREAAELSEPLRSQIDAYCAGVNAAAEAAGALPVEFQLLRMDFEPWRPADMIAALKLLTLGLSTNWEHELLRAEMARELGVERAARLDPRYPAGNPVVIEPGEAWSGDGAALAEQISRVRSELGLAPEASGSNNWAVSGKLTASGDALMAGDPHLPPSMPGIAYQVGLELGDRWVRGMSIPGSPGIFMGQNNEVAWSFTNSMADVMDLYVERVEDGGYRYAGELRPLQTVEERIEVKGRETERLEVSLTHHGPLVNSVLGEDEAEPLALSFTALELPALTDSQVGVLEPRSGPELVAMLEPHCMPVSNLVWADSTGSIGYKTVGRLPVRRGGVTEVPRPGWTGEFEWDGWVPHEEMPEITDPECGYLVTANNRIEGTGFEHHITSEYLDGYRARRIEEMLAESTEHDVHSFVRMQVDDLSIPGLETVRRLTRVEHLATSQREIAAIERLRSWDGRMATSSVAATIYQAFTLRLARETARAAIGDRDLEARWLDRSMNAFVEHVTAPWRWQSHLLSLWDEGDEELIGRRWDEHAIDCLRGALDDLTVKFGADPEGWRWGRVHAMTFPHSLGEAHPLLERVFSRSMEAGGAQETVSQIAFDPGDPYRAVWAPCWRMVADPLRPAESRWQAFTGQSGQVGSRHYDDLQVDWSQGSTQPMRGEGPWEDLELSPGA